MVEDVYTLLAEKHKWASSERYLRILRLLMTPLQARIAAELPAPPQEIAQKLGLPEEQVLSELEDMFYKGVVNARKIFPTRSGYRFWSLMDYLFNYTIISERVKQSCPEVIELWCRFCEEEWYPRLAQDYAQLETPIDRVLPAYKAVADIPEVHPCEDIREIIKAAPVIAVIPCVCRLSAGRCHTALDTCLNFGWQAEYAIAQGTGIRITPEEALARVDKAEEEGQVHVYMNSNFMYGRYICNCCRCCCLILYPPLTYGVPLEKRLSKSRFQAVATGEACIPGCRECLSRCHFNALHLEGDRIAVDPEKCWGCGLCVLKCKAEALKMKLVRPLEHIPGLAQE